MIWLKLKTNLLAGILLISVVNLSAFKKERDMVELAEVVETGGISLDSKFGDSTQGFTISLGEKCIKYSAPNKKGAFDWTMLKGLEFNEVDANGGVMSILFTSNFPGAEKGTQLVGRVSTDAWQRVSALVEGNLALIEKKGSSLDPKALYQLTRVYEWGGITISFGDGKDVENVEIGLDPKSVKILMKDNEVSLSFEKIGSFNYKKTPHGDGMLSVNFTEKVLDTTTMPLGMINNVTWQRLRARVGNQIKMIQD